MPTSANPHPGPARGLHREVLALALPAFATLVSEPLLLIADSAIVGHLGTTPLAGLGIAGNLIGIAAGLCVFLAYGTTATVARQMGAGKRREALAGGIDGILLAVILGVVITVIFQTLGPTLISLYGPNPAVAAEAWTYLRIASFGFPFLLVILASTGVLRGLQDTVTPLKVAITLNLTNIGLNFLLVYGFRLGIGGAALGTVAAQVVAAGFLGFVVIRGARREGTPLRPRLGGGTDNSGASVGGVLQAARDGSWLVLRTFSLQISILTATMVATRLGTISLAAHQLVNSLWVFLAFALDAIAIAAQAIIGRYLGARETATARRVTALMIRWGIASGVVLGAVILLLRPWLGLIFTNDPDVLAQMSQALIAVAITQPISGVVFVLDGVLIGAGDARYLALTGLIPTLLFVPAALWVAAAGGTLTWLWAAYGAYMVGRMLTLTLRIRGSGWMRLGA